jgi:hypothetical protein
MTRYFLLLSVILSVLFQEGLLAQTSDYAIVQGTVREKDGGEVIGASVVVRETRQGMPTNTVGRYLLRNLKPGQYTLDVSCIGYKSVSRPIVLVTGQTLISDFVLESTTYSIGGIDVIADVELLPKEAETRTLIRSDQIEHLQASSLGDVLQLMPGVKSGNPGLVSVQQANLRGSDKDPGGRVVGSFGTQIMLDNVPASNNANMQIDGAPAATASRGIDLRAIPTENVESIEIIRGIPSARHGDLTSGMIHVRTKVGELPHRLKFKYNPNTYEGNLSGGERVWGMGVGYNINVASSERDVRRPGDGFTRIAAQLSALASPLADDAWSLKNILTITRAFDEVKEDPAYAARTAYYNRDINVRYTLNSEYRSDEVTQWYTNLSAAYTHQNSYKQEMVSRDNMVISSLLEPGTIEGRFALGSYLSQYWVKGDVWNLFGEGGVEHRLFTGDFIHTITAGLRVQHDVNRGPGREYDPLFPPGGTPGIGDRPRSYDDLPGMTLASVYVEDRIAGTFWKPFTLQAGFRYEMFNPVRLNLSGLFGEGDFVDSRQGSFFDPRITFSMNLTEDTQLRMGFGKTSKAPPLSMIYPNLRYFDVVDTVAINTTDPSQNFALLSTYIINRGNAALRGYRQTKYEASLDQRIGDVGVSLTGFVNETRGGFSSATVPLTLLKRSWPAWPDQSQFAVKDTLMDKVTVSGNNIWSDARGVEVTLRTRRLPVIQTIVEVAAAYTHYESGEDNGLVFGGQRRDPALGITLFPVHRSEGRFTKDLLIKYRFDVHVEALRIWLTLHLEQQVMEIDGYTGREDSLALGYYTRGGEMVWIPEEQRGADLYSNLRRTRQPYELLEEDRPSVWLVNLRVSKELWPGTELSFFVNNFLNNRPLYRSRRTDPLTYSYERRNPAIYYGLELSAVIEKLFGGGK